MTELNSIWEECGKMEIRKATMDDLEAITLVEAECFPAAEAATKEDFKKRLAVYADHFWLLYDGNLLISFVNGMATDEADLKDEMYHEADKHNEKGKWQMIFGVNTIPSQRKKGYAEQVLRQVIQDSRDEGRSGLVLTCKEALIPFYSKLGFKNEGVSGSEHGNVTWYQMRLRF